MRTIKADLPTASAVPSRKALKLAVVAAVALSAANCSSQKVTSNGRTIDPRYGVAASPRLVEEGQPVPKGGGREMVGKPYQIAGKTYVPRENLQGYSRVGLASWYGSAFHGRMTANGEIFDRASVAAAHTTMPLPSYARVTNLDSNRSMIVRVNDRGPYHANRLIDVSERVAEALEFRRAGTARVRVDYVGRASTNGSDDRKLLATLTTDGHPAPSPGRGAPIMVASADPTPERPQAFAFLGGRAPKETAAPPEPEARVADGVPLPPERPFDLGTIPNAGTPVRAAALAPTSRPLLATMFYVSPGLPGSRFAKADPFKDLKPQRFVALHAGN